MEYLLSTNGVTKQYGMQKAVDNVSMHIERGQIYGFIGRNGAGKTTFLKMVCGLAEPTRGEISLFGYSGKERRDIRSRIGALIEMPGFYPNLSAYDNLKMKCICMGIQEKEYTEELLELVGLQNTKKRVKHYSLGMKQRLGIALAMVGEPDLLVLDEPVNGLDPGGIAEVREIILRLNRERNVTILISSHLLEELSKIVTHYGIIHHGQLLQEITKEELIEKCGERIELTVAEPERVCPVLDRMGFAAYKVVDSYMIHIYDQLDRISEIPIRFSEAGIAIKGLQIAKEELENYFLLMTGGAANA